MHNQPFFVIYFINELVGAFCVKRRIKEKIVSANDTISQMVRRQNVFLVFAIFFVLIALNGYIYLSQARDIERNKLILIDAGHGGNDPGKISATGITEKDINLQIALKLKDKLEEKGYCVIMSRTSDCSLASPSDSNKKRADLENRVKLANDNRVDCMISIHQNSYPESYVRGAQVFYGASKESEQLAEHIQKFIRTNVDSKNKREKKPGDTYYILKKSSCPGVILECGFLSCPEEANKLQTEEYQTLLVDAIALALDAYFSEKP